MVTSGVEQINPAFAEQVLADQVQLEEERGVALNRPVSRSRVQQYAREMAAGRWMLNGEPIIFNGRRLIEGQHRLLAVVESQTSVPMLVVRGIDEAAFTTINQGAPRSAADLAHGLGVTKQLRVKAAAAHLVLAYTRDRKLPCDPRRRYTKRQVAEHMALHRDDWDAAVAATQDAYRTTESSSQLFALSYLVRRRAEERWEFFYGLKTGANLHEQSPVRHLRERLMASRGIRGDAESAMRFAWAVKCWNSYVQNEPMRLLKYNPAQDVFPQVLT